MNQTYHPLYFLAALGNGGLAVSFFMYLMFMVPHPDTPMVTFNHIYPYVTAGNMFVQVSIITALLGLVFFTIRHFQKLFWNLSQWKAFKQTDAYKKMIGTNGEVSFMAVPLTLSMTVNVLFVLGAVFIPNLWSVIDVLLPFSLAAFAAIAYYALVLFIPMMTRFFTEKSFNPDANNNFSQLLSVFAFTMIAVGLAAPAAMSSIPFVYVTAMLMSILLFTLAAGLLVIQGTLAIESIFKNGLAKEGSPTVWMIIPILTLAGITFVRLASGVSHNILDTNPSAVMMFIVLAVFLTAQTVSGLFGYSVLTKNGYFSEFVNGEGKSPASYGLICPGVAYFVLGMFFIQWGLVNPGIVDKFSAVYFAVMIPFIAVQFKTIAVLVKLNRKHFAHSSLQNSADYSGQAARS
ncbi:TsoY family (seleno)protein [Salisediminibacterium halotolerans]|uniref:TsoY family (seleno)protein n=1 Tax=Salisediminibacterium halotolerans TaxID=517425 RepID=UPI000EAE346B|nr:hypothetical protein [Salisediminibacterium halotolerans]RLJ72248.1 hypothetical protein BCL39_2145 [Actinophytocola xinjiangensis]RPE85462.1 hypothetical protein EDD67_2280 [Salisediminibacterium halotolerans]TWG33418.1 hypothetical protein BCL52_2141 [Salisediminibacterium halotolerans]GEL07859.1 hypothetical protein SHA02_12750 [Salisediminibacterium halotolerans]